MFSSLNTTIDQLDNIKAQIVTVLGEESSGEADEKEEDKGAKEEENSGKTGGEDTLMWWGKNFTNC